MQCDTFTVSGYFTQYGSCFYNVATVTSPANTTWQDSVCVEVTYPCTDSTTLIIPANTYSTTLDYRYDTLNIYIAGTLYVNDTLKLMRCTVYMDAQAQITVMNGGYLDIDSSTVTGCTNMWRGITVEDFGEVKIHEGSLIADGDTTILAKNKSKVNIDNAHFRNFVLGVYIPPKTGTFYNGTVLTVQQATFEFNAFKPDYAGQNPHGSKSQCGVMLNDWIGTLGTYQQAYQLNKFINLNCGIAAERSQLTIKNCYFNKIQRDLAWSKPFNGTAIYSMGDVLQAKAANLIVQPLMNNAKTMGDCYKGIYTNYSSLSMTGVRMDSMWVGIQILNCKDYLKTTVSGNEIKANRMGIMASVNAGAKEINISNNTIYMQSSSIPSATGISIAEVNKNGIGNYTIYQNILYLYDAQYGIRMLNNYKPVVTHNNIEQNGTSVYGIQAMNSDSTIVKCNQVRTTTVTNITSKGISYSLSKNGIIACNSIDSTSTAMQFGGNCAGTQIKANTMRNNLLGLYINNVGIIGVQTNNGNKFIDYRDTIGAYNANLQQSGLSLSRFLLKNGTQQGSVYFPILAQQNNSWFVDNQTLNPFQCGATCYDMIDAPDNEMLYRIIAGDSILTEDFIPESQSMARQYLFEILDNDSALRNSDTLFTNFYNTMIIEAEGQLKEVERRFETYGKMDSTFMPVLNNIDSLSYLLNTNITRFDEMRDSIELLGINPDSLREQWILQIASLDSTRADIIMQYNAVQSGEMYEGELTNNIINGDEQNETNSSLMNNLFAQLEDAIYTNVDELYSQLLNIAVQCPYYGGEAVYRARAAIALLNDSIEYNDAANCLLYGIYRTGITDSTIIDEKIEVKPNPASDFFSIEVSCKENEMYVADIINATGQKVLTKILLCNERYNVNINGIQPGAYTVVVRTKNKIQNFKLVIVR